jgi:hypothetical protein
LQGYKMKLEKKRTQQQVQPEHDLMYIFKISYLTVGAHC